MQPIARTVANHARIGLRALLAVAIVFSAFPAHTEEPSEPSVDTLLQQLLQLDPAELAQRVNDMKAHAESLDAESAQLRQQAAQLETQIESLKAKLGPFLDILKAVAEAEGMAPQPDAEPAPQAMAPEPNMTPEGAMAPEPAMMAAESDMAAEPAASSAPNFVEHVLPILEARCLRCHDEDRQRGGLSLATFDAALYGGGSGKVIDPGNPGGSRLVRLVMQTEEPKMPPSGDPLTAEEIQVLRDWIAGGTLANAGAESMVAKVEIGVGEEPAFVAARIADTPPLPEIELARVAKATDRSVVARAIAASPTAPLAAVGGNRQILLYDLERLILLGALDYPEGEAFTLSFSVNGEILLAGGGREGDSGSVVLWNIRQGERIGEFAKGYDTVLAADVSPDHTLLAAGGPNRAVRVYSTRDGSELYRIDNHTDWIYAVKFSPDGELLATADRAGNLFLWQAANGRLVEGLRGHEGAIHGMAYSADSNVLATAGEDGGVILWDTWKYTQLRKFNAHSGAVLAVDFSADGHLVTSGRDGHTKRWDLNGNATTTYDQLSDWAYQARFAAAGNLVLSGAWNGNVAVWNAESGERVTELTTNPAPDLMLATAENPAPGS